jgi:ABC-type phosphate transport system permease subunit
MVDDCGGLPMTAAYSREDRMNLLYRQVPTSSWLSHAEEATLVLGANRWQVFWQVFVPLSIPGMLAGSVLVFLLTASSFVRTRLSGMALCCK